MLLSIIIPVYNGAKHITNCLNSIWAQELGIDDYEVICVDDCSTDNTVSVLYSISKEHNNLRIIKNDINEYITIVFQYQSKFLISVHKY